MWGSEQFVSVDRQRLRVVSTGTGPPLLLINGIGASAEMWAPLVARLDGHQIVAVDLPGVGSSPPSRRPLRMRSLAEIVVGVLDVLGYRRVDVLGYSFGAVLAQELVWRAPERVGRLVLAAASSGVGSVPSKPLAGALMLTPTRYQNRAVARRILPAIAGGRTRRDRGVLEANLEHRLANPPSRLGYLQQLYAVTGWTSNPWLRRIRHRTLILHGDDDPLVPVINARNMARIMPEARLYVVPGAGHLFLLDEPGLVVGELTGFLAR
jgi:poly(3-hydroxyalkanoate) depolymerase